MAEFGSTRIFLGMPAPRRALKDEEIRAIEKLAKQDAKFWVEDKYEDPKVQIHNMWELHASDGMSNVAQANAAEAWKAYVTAFIAQLKADRPDWWTFQD